MKKYHISINFLIGTGFFMLSSLGFLSSLHAEDILLGAPIPGVESRAVEENRTVEEPSGMHHEIGHLELKDAKVTDAIRLITGIAGGLNVVATPDAGKNEVTLFLRNISVRGAIETLSKVAGLWFREDKQTGVIRMMTTEEYQKDLVIFREDLTRVFTLLHPNAISAATAIEDLYGSRVILSLGEAPDGSANSSSASSGSSSSGSGGTRGSGGGRREQSVLSRRVKSELTPDKIAAIEARQSAQGKADQNVSSDTLEAVTQQEAPIFVTVNQTHNLVIVRTSDIRVMKEIERLIATIDRPTPQVLLEMKILQMTLGDDFRSVFDFGHASSGAAVSGPPTGLAPNPLQTATAGVREILGVGNFPLEGGTLVYQFMNNEIAARVQLFQEDKRVDTIATPMILASNYREAKLFIGEERVLVTGVSSETITPATGAAFTVIQPTTEIRNIGTTISITPKINADRTVMLDIVQDSSSVLPNSASIPVPKPDGGVDSFFIDSVNTANIKGTIVAMNGLTVAIGGLIRTEVTDVIRKVPILGSIPLLGLLFQRKVEERRKTELILLITPRVLMTPAEGQAITEERLRELSRHPYQEKGDAALDEYFEKEQPEDLEGEVDGPISQKIPDQEEPHTLETGIEEADTKEPDTKKKVWRWTGERPEGSENTAKSGKGNQ